MTLDPTAGMPATISGKPVISKSNVESVISLLLDSKGSVTTLDVKNELRRIDLYATQDMASYFMDQVFQERQGTADELERSSNGSFFTYTLADTSTNAALTLLNNLPSKRAFDPAAQAAINALPVNVATSTASFGNVMGTKVAASTGSQFNSTPLQVNPNTAYLKATDNQNWYAYDFENNLQPALFDKSLTRDQVRASHARLVGIGRDDARACRLVNLAGYAS